MTRRGIIDGVVVIQGTMTTSSAREPCCAPSSAETHRSRRGDIRTTQRSARVRMPVEIPRLVMSLKNAWEAANPNAMAMPTAHSRLMRPRRGAPAQDREGRSADAMSHAISTHRRPGLPLKRLRTKTASPNG